MKKTCTALLCMTMIASALMLGACSSEQRTPMDAPEARTEIESHHTVTAEEAKKMIEGGAVTVVDVRTQEEYDDAHIPDAVLIPVDTIGSEKIGALPEDGPLLVYCHSGVRSRHAAERLAAIGYTQVYDMGGIIDWPYATER